jgi:hypothetical protein
MLKQAERAAWAAWKAAGMMTRTLTKLAARSPWVAVRTTKAIWVVTRSVEAAEAAWLAANSVEAVEVDEAAESKMQADIVRQYLTCPQTGEGLVD